MKDKYLITTDQWFVAPDGQQYKAAWGEVKIIEDSFLGVKTNRNSANWLAKVGSDNKHVLIAGCQVHYAIKCDTEPNTEDVFEFGGPNGEEKLLVPTRIYIAQ